MNGTTLGLVIIVVVIIGRHSRSRRLISRKCIRKNKATQKVAAVSLHPLRHSLVHSEQHC